MHDPNLHNREKLLSDVAEGLKRARLDHGLRCDKSGLSAPDMKLVHVDVKFFVGEQQVWDGNLEDALDVIANDLFWDDSRNWADADRAEVSY